jgi:hypothetical protein
MPIPAEITGMNQAAKLVGTFPLQFNNPNPRTAGRAQLTRTFHVYLEVAMQAKHDALMRGYCQRIGVQGRPQAGSQITGHGTNADAVLGNGGFYEARAQTAADAVKTQMVARWGQQQQQGQQVFTPGQRVDAAIQSQVQNDNYRYEISYWYDGDDVYVLFHCYP